VEVHLKLAKLRRDTAEQEQPSLEPGSDTLGALNWRMAAPSSWMKSVTSPTCRSRFLRVLQERTLRESEESSRSALMFVIAATNRKLKTAIADGSFREDLFYRLNYSLLKFHRSGSVKMTL
jgi:hypothetical protein